MNLWFHAFCVHIKNEEISWWNRNLDLVVVHFRAGGGDEEMDVLYVFDGGMLFLCSVLL
jgi:hypothetical protein